MVNFKVSQSDIIADLLLEEINDGKYPEGAKLPSLRKLAQRYNVSVSTARSAMQRLLAAKKVIGLLGSGYYICRENNIGTKRHILIFNRPGDMYSAMLEDILQFKSCHPDMIVSVESINQSAERIQARIEQLIEEGLDTIFMNSILFTRMHFLEQYISRLNMFGFFHFPKSLDGMSLLPGVYSDWYHGGYIGIRHLVDCGCKNILFILSSQGTIQSECMEGALAAAQDVGVKVNLTIIYEQDIYCPENSFKITELEDYLKQEACGIFCFRHSIAFKCYDYLKSNKFRIPEDVKLLEYYDSEQSLDFSPSLSSISVRPKEISAELLNMYINHNRQYVIVKPTLIVRDSTMPKKNTP